MSGRGFGLLIAYVIPGFGLLWALQDRSETVQSWLEQGHCVAGTQPTIGGFLYATLASIGLGVFLSGIRWLTIDQLHVATGVRRPNWDDSLLETRLDGYVQLVEEHYRYYQAYANGLIAFAIAVTMNHASIDSPIKWVAVSAVAGVLLASSRDTLLKCYSRLSQLLRLEQQGKLMTNGGPQHHSDPKPLKEKAKGKEENVDKAPAKKDN